ncbi:MAG TPA: holo-ACP synthase [Oculatellaceae cyanobacterium]
MNLVAHGIDLVEVPGFNDSLREEPEGMLERCFTPFEVKMAEAHSKVESLAGWFATKEAVLKALGYGFANDLAFTDIEIRHNEFGAPYLVLSGECAKVAKKLEIGKWLVSISHTGSTAIGSVIGLRQDDERKGAL